MLVISLLIFSLHVAHSDYTEKYPQKPQDFCPCDSYYDDILGLPSRSPSNIQPGESSTANSDPNLILNTSSFINTYAELRNYYSSD